MGGSLIIRGCSWMLSVVDLFPIGDLADLEQPGLEVKKLIRGTLGENSSSNQVPHHDLKSQEYVRIGTGIGRSLEKEKREERGRERSHMNARTTDQETVTTETATGLKRKRGVVEVMIKPAMVIGTAVVTTSETEIGVAIVTVGTASAIVIKGGIEIGTMKLVMLMVTTNVDHAIGIMKLVMSAVTTNVGPAIGIGIVTDTVREKRTMIKLRRWMILDGMSNPKVVGVDV